MSGWQALIDGYLAAYDLANGHPCQSKLVYENGWFVFWHEGRVDGRYHRAKLEAMRLALLERAVTAPQPREDNR